MQKRNCAQSQPKKQVAQTPQVQCDVISETPQIVKKLTKKERLAKKLHNVHLSESSASFGDSFGREEIHSKYVQCVYQPHKVQSRIPTSFPVRSSLYYKRIIKEITIDSSGETAILVRPWDLYTDSGTNTDTPAFINIKPGNQSGTVWNDTDRHPMQGYGGGYGSERYTQYRIVSTVINVKYAGKVTDYSGMYTGALLPGFGDEIDTDAAIPTLSEMNSLPYSYNTPIKSNSEHKLCFLPVDGMDTIFTKPEAGSDEDSISTRGQLLIRLTDCDEAAKFQLVVDTVVEFIPSAPFAQWSPAKPNLQKPGSINLVRKMAIHAPIQSIKAGSEDQEGWWSVLEKVGRQSLKLVGQMPGTAGMVASTLDSLLK